MAIITAYAAVKSARLAVKCGAIDYLTKPYSVADVEGIVAKAVRVLQKQHDAEVLTAQLSRVTETLIKRSQDGDGHPPVADALDTLRTVQDSLSEDLASVRELSELGEVAAEVSHDINNLLTVILTSSQFLLRQLDRSAETDLRRWSHGFPPLWTPPGLLVDDSAHQGFHPLEYRPEPGPINLSAIVASAVDSSEKHLLRGAGPWSTVCGCPPSLIFRAMKWPCAMSS